MYRRAYQFKQIPSIEAEHGKRIVVQVNDVPLNSWARTLIRKDNHFYFRNPTATRWFSGVNTWMAVDTVQRYMQDHTFPKWDGVYTALSAPGYKSIMDYVATLRAAAIIPAALWWFDHSLRSQLVT